MLIPTDILNDLSSRFLINLPPSERDDPVRLCFQLEQAHWYYTDFYRPDRQDCPKVGYREFARQVFAHCPIGNIGLDEVDAVIDEWRRYKGAVPTYGAVLLDPTLSKVLLVQGFYARSSWGFPKGKVNENEPPDICAIREVCEETGFDMTTLVDPEHYLELRIFDSITRLYLVPGVPVDFDFKPQTRNEIKKIIWFTLADIPTHRNDHSKTAFGHFPNHFFTVIPFVEGIRSWIAYQRDHPGENKRGGLGRQLNPHGEPGSPYKRNHDQNWQSTPRPLKGDAGSPMLNGHNGPSVSPIVDKYRKSPLAGKRNGDVTAPAERSIKRPSDLSASVERSPGKGASASPVSIPSLLGKKASVSPAPEKIRKSPRIKKREGRDGSAAWNNYTLNISEVMYSYDHPNAGWCPDGWRKLTGAAK